MQGAESSQEPPPVKWEASEPEMPQREVQRILAARLLESRGVARAICEAAAVNVDEQRCRSVGLRERDVEKIFLVRSVLDRCVVVGRDGAELEGRCSGLQFERLRRRSIDRRGIAAAIAATGGEKQGCAEEGVRDSVE